nr:DNA polymerase [Rhodopirellula sp. SM50]
MVATDILSGETVRERLWDRHPKRCPISLDDRSLYVSYYAAAEITCHIAMEWEIPARILDLQVEFRVLANGRDRTRSAAEKLALKSGERHSLLACMFAFGLTSDAAAASHKDEMRELCMRGGPYSSHELRSIVDYCETDVTALVNLLPKMSPHVELAPALFRGRYMAAVAAMERRGIPVDAELAERFKANWNDITERLVARNRDKFDVIGDKDIDQRKFATWLESHGLGGWPRTPEGRLSTSSNTLSDWAKYVPPIMQLKEFLQTVRRTRLFDKLRIGSDGRNRFLLSPFGSKTGRNTPSNALSVFGPACWVRSLIQPPPGYALLYCDWSGQEYGEAAYFSGDERMIADYANDDPYLGFGKRIRLVPPYATKKSHKKLRNQLKVAAGLGVLYGAQPPTVARAGDMTESTAAYVLREHRYTYRKFWDWRQQVIDHARLVGEFRTCLGWTWQVTGADTTTSISNWMMQAHGAEMLRVACCLAIERGVEVCTPVHDALLVQAPIEEIESVRLATVQCMEEASSLILGGPRLKVGVDPPTVSPNRFSDERGSAMWDQLTGILSELEADSVRSFGRPEQVLPSTSFG